MSYVVRTAISVSEGSTNLTSTVNRTVEGCDKRSEAIALDATDYNIVIGIDVSSLQVFAMKAGQDLTVKTNNSGAPQETISLVADRPIVWQEGDAALFAGDVTGVFVTNASGVATTLEIVSATDTP